MRLIECVTLPWCRPYDIRDSLGRALFPCGLWMEPAVVQMPAEGWERMAREAHVLHHEQYHLPPKHGYTFTLAKTRKKPYLPLWMKCEGCQPSYMRQDKERGR